MGVRDGSPEIKAPVSPAALRAECKKATDAGTEAAGTDQAQWHAESFYAMPLGVAGGVSGEPNCRPENPADQLAAITAHGLRFLTAEQLGKIVDRTAFSLREVKMVIEAVAETLGGG